MQLSVQLVNSMSKSGIVTCGKVKHTCIFMQLLRLVLKDSHILMIKRHLRKLDRSTTMYSLIVRTIAPCTRLT